MKRAQVAMEYTFAVSFALIIAALALFSVLIVQDRATGAQTLQNVEDVSAQIQQELVLATQVRDGYRREVLLPDTLGAQVYSISNSAAAVTVTSRGTSSSRTVPEFTGNFAPGMNVIMKSDGVIVVS